MNKYTWRVRYHPPHGDKQEDTVVTSSPDVTEALTKWQRGKNLGFVGIETVEILFELKMSADREVN